jgi:hypothetical protein
MDRSDKLVFYNRQGYLYNFQYDEFEQKWEGKVFFDENSSELFKTKTFYLFESVDPINFSAIFDMEPSQLFNWSGITFVPKKAEDQLITDIEKVNNDSSFHTKWIYGQDFETKFPQGTIVSFSGETSGYTGGYWGDFVNSAQTYFCIMGTKKDAVLISTLTNNSTFTNVDFFTGLTLTSHNIIKVPDYGNEYLVDINNLNYYEDKKLNIVNSFNNDGIYTYRDYSILKNKTFDFDLSTQTTGTLNLSLTLYTERPKLYTGPVDISITDNTVSGSTLIFENGINNDLDFFNTGQTIIFEKYNGDGILPTNPIFTITSYKDKVLLANDQCVFRTVNVNNKTRGEGYYIATSGYTADLTGLTNVDQIYLVADPIISGSTFHNGRVFDVISVRRQGFGLAIEVEQYVNDEGPNQYYIYKKFKKSQVDTIYAQQTSYLSSTGYTGGSNCFATTNVISMDQSILYSGGTNNYYENTIGALNIRYGNFLKTYGIELFHHTYSGVNYLIVDGLFEYNYHPMFNASASINGTPLLISNNFTFTTGFTNSDVYYFEVDEQLTSERVALYDSNYLSKNYSAEIVFNLQNDLLNKGFIINFNGANYIIEYSSSSGTTSYTHETINNFITKYDDVFNNLGFDLSSGYTSSGYTLNIDGLYPNLEIINLNVDVNTYSTYSITNDYNEGIVISSNELRSIFTSLYANELATGMIMSISGSQYPLNNKDYNIIRITDDIIQLSYQGPFFYDYGVTLDISTREFLRKPRSYYDKIVDYKFSWDEPSFGEITKTIFYYDFTGDQLIPYNDISGLTYIGPKPLYRDGSSDKVFLNRYPNKLDTQIKNPSAQQTIFDELNHRLEMLNDSSAYDYAPIPMEINIGFNSPQEGVFTNKMKLEKIEYLTFSGTTQNSGLTNFESHFIISGSTIQYITNNYLFDFNSLGFETDQLISLDFIEIGTTGQTLFTNYGNYRIKDITQTKIFIDTDYSSVFDYYNTKQDLLYSGKTYNYIIKVEPREIASIDLYGQSEIEDERYDILLRNLGIDIYKDEEFIFKESDIKEKSVDYTRLNRKRKEMLSIYPEIFNYVGSYKALIHAIDYFGYNDLKLYEYYRNIKPGSPLYGKLQKILIPDIFDNSVEGWNPVDFIQKKYDKGYYKKTNLFNLTYRITDIYGNYVQHYSLEEIQIKLMALVRWLRRNIIPLSSNIRDITGVADAIHTLSLRHDTTNWVSKSVISQNNVGVNFNYTTTMIDNYNYLFTINFYTLSGLTAPDFFTCKIQTFSIDLDTNELIPQQNFSIFKTDYEPYSFNLNLEVDPFIKIETTSYNGYGVGYMNSKMFKFNERRNYYLINTNFNATKYAYVSTSDGYYIIEDGRYYILN